MNENKYCKVFTFPDIGVSNEGLANTNSNPHQPDLAKFGESLQKDFNEIHGILNELRNNIANNIGHINYIYMALGFINHLFVIHQLETTDSLLKKRDNYQRSILKIVHQDEDYIDEPIIPDDSQQSLFDTIIEESADESNS